MENENNRSDILMLFFLIIPLILSYFIPQLKILAFIIGFISTLGFIFNDTLIKKVFSFVVGSLFMLSYFNETFLIFNLIFGLTLLICGIIVISGRKKNENDAAIKTIYLDNGNIKETINTFNLIRSQKNHGETIFIFGESIALHILLQDEKCTIVKLDNFKRIKRDKLMEIINRAEFFIKNTLQNYVIIDSEATLKTGDKE